MENYNVCVANIGGEFECLAYAGRSAYFFHMKLYGKAMNEIEISLNNDEIQRNDSETPAIV